MQPTDVVAPASSPPPEESPTDKFDFMLKDKPKPKKGFKLPLPKLPKPVLIGLGAGLGIIILILLTSMLFGQRGSGNDKFVTVMARSQEIIRVSGVAQQQAKTSNPALSNLIATTSVVLTSQQSQLNKYLQANKVKVSTGKLNTYLNKSIDAQLVGAAQNNNLATVYGSYLKDQLTNYQTALNTAYKNAGKSGKTILSADYDSIKALLSAPQLSTN